MDSPDLAESRHVRALRGLARINLLSLAAERVWAAIQEISPTSNGPIRILDVACGGGDVALAVKSRAERAGIPTQVEGCDMSPVAVHYATARALEQGLDVTFFHHDATVDEFPGPFDLICSSLFLHHLADPKAVGFLAKLAATGGAILVQDLLRTRLGYLLAWAAVRTVTRSRVVRVDGPRSVRAAFSLPEVEALAQEAGLAGARISRCWPERFTLTWEGL